MLYLQLLASLVLQWYNKIVRLAAQNIACVTMSLDLRFVIYLEDSVQMYGTLQAKVKNLARVNKAG